jgi:hypothetical protein
MHTTEVPAAAEQPIRLPYLTWGWVLRRSALWIVILVAAISLACWLYAVASPDGTQDHGAVQGQRPPAVVNSG